MTISFTFTGLPIDGLALESSVPAVGTDIVFTVSLDQAPVADVTVTLSTTDDSAVSPDDFTAATDAMLTFSPGGGDVVVVEDRYAVRITDIENAEPEPGPDAAPEEVATASAATAAEE